ncbi:hypothetical protein Y1Q_0024332 [Alligator mississippiensis]|uniref:Nicotinamide N-methyltransferase-like n=1 Tax=Alligator mississippiensis TaxID=8496 RepID=A0A151NIM4_ALLMI|nr:hypothetical protein Y1Q_0024332 [Alligator mississippiensis]
MMEQLSAALCASHTIGFSMEPGAVGAGEWLKELGALDLTPAVKYVCELQGQKEKWAEKEEKLRKKVKQVLKCDVRKRSPLAPVTLPMADCLLSMLCLEAVCKDLATFRAAVKNISSLVKPGGHLVLNTVLKGTYYLVGQHNFSCLGLDQESVEAAVRDAGCVIEHIQEVPEPAPLKPSQITLTWSVWWHASSRLHDSGKTGAGMRKGAGDRGCLEPSLQVTGQQCAP